VASYKAQDFLKAIPGTGGIVSALAERVGCDWHTARRYIDTHATVKEAWEAERNKITDKARHNIVKAIGDGDLQMSKWWLQVMDAEFVPRAKAELTGTLIVVDWDDSTQIEDEST
jgi:hypothetical protein